MRQHVVFVIHCTRFITHPLKSSSMQLLNILERSAPKSPDITTMSATNRIKVMNNYTKRKKAHDSKRKRTIEDIVIQATMFRCPCEKLCLLNVGSTISESVDLMKEYMTPWILMSRSEHREKFFPILEGCVEGVSEGGHLEKK